MGSLIGIFGFDTTVVSFVQRVLATGVAKSAQDLHEVSRPC